MTPFRTLPAALAALAALLAGQPASAAEAPSLPKTLTATLEATLAATDTPGAAATITRHGRTVWSVAAGQAATEDGRPFRRDTLSSVASVTKMLTASIVMRLVEGGVLHLDAPVAGLVPADVPDAGRVTLRDLLGMRSGYADTENDPAFLRKVADPNHRWTDADFFGPLKPPHFKPGSQVEYSNVNFVLLGKVIDAVYPGGVGAAFDELVRRPARLGDAAVFRRDPCVAGRVAHGYQTQNGTTADVSHGARDLGVSTAVWGTIWTDGGLVATADGLARFGDALFGGQIVRPATLAAMEAPLAHSSQGLGLEEATIDGHRWYGHVGAFDGYTAVLLHDPVRDVTIAGVANALDADTGAQEALFLNLIAAYDGAVDGGS